MINTINISLPSRLKEEAENLVSAGHFVSFSDLVRTAIRKLLSESKYDLLAKEAIQEYKRGETKALKNNTDIKKFVESLTTK